MSLPSDVLCTELESIIAYAKTQDITGKWLQSLQARVRAYRPHYFLSQETQCPRNGDQVNPRFMLAKRQRYLFATVCGD
jgi:hypothetical protein